MQVCFIIFDLSFQMVVISSRSATVDICPCKMFRTRVEPHEPDLLLFALSVWREWANLSINLTSNVNVRKIFDILDILDNSHCWIVEQITGCNM